MSPSFQSPEGTVSPSTTVDWEDKAAMDKESNNQKSANNELVWMQEIQKMKERTEKALGEAKG